MKKNLNVTYSLCNMLFLTYIYQNHNTNTFLVSKTSSGQLQFIEEPKIVTGSTSSSPNPGFKPGGPDDSSNTFAWIPNDRLISHLLNSFLTGETG